MLEIRVDKFGRFVGFAGDRTGQASSMCLWDIVLRSDRQPSQLEAAWTRLSALLADEPERFAHWEIETSINDQSLELIGYAVLRMEARDRAAVVHAIRSLLGDAGLSAVADAPARDTSEVAFDVLRADRPWGEAMHAMESRLDPSLWSA